MRGRHLHRRGLTWGNGGTKIADGMYNSNYFELFEGSLTGNVTVTMTSTDSYNVLGCVAKGTNMRQLIIALLMLNWQFAAVTPAIYSRLAISSAPDNRTAMTVTMCVVEPQSIIGNQT